DVLRKSAQMHNEVTRLDTHRESLLGQRGRLSERDARIASDLENTLEQKMELERRVGELTSLVEEQTRRAEEKRAQAARTEDVRRALVEELASAKERRSALQSRREVLEDLQQRMEGVGAAARRLLTERQSADAPLALRWMVGLVADLFDTDFAHAPVIEAVLGQTAQALVVEQSDEFLAYTTSLPDLPSRLSVICIDRLAPVIKERSFSDHPGFVARALELVRFDDAHEHLAWHLFGKTIVVDDLNTALELSAQDITGHRFVTTKGELVDEHRQIRLGPPSSDTGLISRRSELREIETRMVETDDRIRVLADRITRTQAELAHIETVVQELQRAIYSSGTDKAETTAALQSIADTIHRLTSEQPLIAQEVALIEQQITEVFQKSEEGNRSLAVIERENEERQSRVASHQQAIDEIVDTRRAVQEDLTQVRVSAGQCTEKREAAVHRMQTVRRTIQELQEATAGARHDIEQCEARIADAEETIEQARQRWSTLSHRIEELETSCTALRHRREQLRQETENLSQTVKSARTRLETAEAALHETQTALAETKVRRDALVVRVTEELDIDLALEYERYEHEEQDWQAVESEIAELRGKMDRLGNVNLDAIKELDELQERHAFLTGQRDDLLESKRQLEQLIHKLNRESRDRFQENFEKIRENFRTLFRKLFGGGRADIVLEDPDNMLECGIEILAQPPGKELRTITLMSGGEKSLTAIALLMSIFKLRPAPFAILDEVDAALDEANNERFNLIIKEFVDKAQFLVITHSKWTMNMADRLYGITMQEPGVSTRVGVELTGVQVA
ncbi:MAG: hypothetical protein O7F08_07260, partial [Deltaproteobacteria bacterium]|nr:hypothetical protein [Deltaproteobacteria bacterium]